MGGGVQPSPELAVGCERGVGTVARLGLTAQRSEERRGLVIVGAAGQVPAQGAPQVFGGTGWIPSAQRCLPGAQLDARLPGSPDGDDSIGNKGPQRDPGYGPKDPSCAGTWGLQRMSRRPKRKQATASTTAEYARA